MKKLFFLLIFLIPVFGIAQESQTINVVNKNEILYKYTFEGMKNISESNKIITSTEKLAGVKEVVVVFKTAEHQYAQLKVKVAIPEGFNESTPDITGPSTLKKLLSELGYIPSECQTISFEKK